MWVAPRSALLALGLKGWLMPTERARFVHRVGLRYDSCACPCHRSGNENPCGKMCHPEVGGHA